MGKNDLFRKTMTQVFDLLKRGKITPQEVIESCNSRIAATQPNINYFVSEIDLNETNLSPNSKKDLPLQGIPFSVKDNFSTEEIATTCASKMLENYIPNFNATIVEKLLAHGGTMMGKDNMDEFAMGSGGCESYFGAAKNPWNHEKLGEDFYVPGGSSGGSASAVASGATYFSIGSDTGGSVRVPASFCGIVGLKPTYGAFSRYGLIPLCNSLDVPGIFTRSIEDAALVFNILKGHDVNDSTTISQNIPDVNLKKEEDLNDFVVGIPKEHYIDGTVPKIRELWDKAIEQFESAGAKIVEVSLPHTEYVQQTYRILCCSDVASNFARFDGVRYGHRARAGGNLDEEIYTLTRDEGFSEKVKRRITAGNFFLLEENYERYFKKGMQMRRLIHDDYAKVFGQHPSSPHQPLCDVMLTPTTSVTSQLYSCFKTLSDLGSGREGEHKDLAGVPEMDYHVTAINLAGVPAVSVPTGMSLDAHGNEMPVGLQVIGGKMQEGKVLRAAKVLEQESNFQYYTDKW